MARWDASRSTIEVRVPANISDAELLRHVPPLLARVRRKVASENLDDAFLARRAEELRRIYLPEAPPAASVTWSDRQQHRWGSCSTHSAQIRISHRLAHTPDYVLDAVLVHELAHLLLPNHGPEFKRLVAQYPKLDLAEAYLAGYSKGLGMPSQGGPADDC